MAALAAALVLVAFVIAYRFYARFLGTHVYEDQEDIVTPAHELEDGVDFVPTQRAVLFGHHFTSIAGAAPIIGPCVAAYWGWGPALAWVVLGGIVRVIFYKEYEWLPKAGTAQVPALMVKHVVMVGLTVWGLIGVIALQRKYPE